MSETSHKAVCARGGKARAKALSKRRRSAIARKASRARWAKHAIAKAGVRG